MTQDKALAFLKSGKNIFLTGSAGTGKTYVLNSYIKYLKERKVWVAVTASTGIAATHMNGMTIHSWAGIGIKDKINRQQLERMKAKKYLREHLEKVQVLVIDEISMLHRSQFEMVNTVLQFFKESTEAFGGVQIVVTGDFYQLPPIGRQGESTKDKFAFMAPAWVQASFNVCYLTDQYRQDSTNMLAQILNGIREGELSKIQMQQLENTLTTEDSNFEEDRTMLYTHNASVDRLNNAHLEKLKGKSYQYLAKTYGNDKLVQTLKKSVLAPETLSLKKDAKVMFVRNDTEGKYVNGTLGHVTGFDEDGVPVVLTLQGKKISLSTEKWSVQDDKGRDLASFDQIPLRLAWALTIHKCQGMTLDSAVIDLANTFENGQGYVALSRLKSIEGLQLVGLKPEALLLDGLARKADERFKVLSKEVDANYAMEELQKQAPVFIKRCGGLTDLNEIKKHSKKIKEKKGPKQSTYEITLGFIRKEMSLEAIAEERGLSPGTIASHLIKLREKYPTENLEAYKPSVAILKKVDSVRKKLKDDEKGLKPIYDKIGGELSYDEIRLALAFL